MSGNFDPRRIPIIGDDIYQVGQVLDIVSQPCDPDPWIAVAATWTYVPTLFWMLAKPEPFDAFTELRGGRHKRIRRGRARITDILALNRAQPGTTGYQVFRLGAAAERLGWYLLLADAATDYALNWTSMVYEWSGCTEPTNGYAAISGPGGFRGGGLTPITGSVAGNSFDSDSPGYGGISIMGINAYGPKTWSWSAEMSVSDYLSTKGQIHEVFEVVRTLGRSDDRADAPLAGENAGKRYYSHARRIANDTYPPTEVSVHVTWSGSLTINNFEASMYGANGRNGLLPDP